MQNGRLLGPLDSRSSSGTEAGERHVGLIWSPGDHFMISKWIFDCPRRSLASPIDAAKAVSGLERVWGLNRPGVSGDLDVPRVARSRAVRQRRLAREKDVAYRLPRSRSAPSPTSVEVSCASTYSGPPRSRSDLAVASERHDRSFSIDGLACHPSAEFALAPWSEWRARPPSRRRRCTSPPSGRCLDVRTAARTYWRYA